MKTYLISAVASLLVASCTVPPAPPTPPQPPVPPDATVIIKLLEAHNAERTSRGLPALVQSPALTKAAQLHSDDQASRGRMSHTGSDGSSPFQRMERAGYKYSYAGENVAYGQANVAAVMASWMGSPGHRRNILSKNYTEIGVGVTNGRDGRPYWTATFGRSYDGVKRGVLNAVEHKGDDASSITLEP